MTSMTAFARGECTLASGQLTWEIRTVNHRYLDIHLKLPEQLRQFEITSRKQISAVLGRGRVDCLLKFEQSPATKSAIELDPQALDSAEQLFNQLAARFPEMPPPGTTDLMSFPGIIKQAEADTELLQKAASELLDQTLQQLTAMRRREGEQLSALIASRITSCRSLVEKLQQVLPDVEESLRQRWNKRLAELDDQLDPGRLHQELAILLNKSDASEELDRLNTHLAEVSRILESEKRAGRRLDFLMQELNREANTLSAKSSSNQVTSTALELKVLIEQMREQVQNIE